MKKKTNFRKYFFITKKPQCNKYASRHANTEHAEESRGLPSDVSCI